jgi:hypothetical protein
VPKHHDGVYGHGGKVRILDFNLSLHGDDCPGSSFIFPSNDHMTGGWIGLRAVLDAGEKKKIPGIPAPYNPGHLGNGQ